MLGVLLADDIIGPAGDDVVRGPATYSQLKRASQHTSAATVASAAE
jgi:hypothetical protein